MTTKVEEKVELKSVTVVSEYPAEFSRLTDLLAEKGIPILEVGDALPSAKLIFLHKLLNQAEGTEPKATLSELVIYDDSTPYIHSEFDIPGLIAKAGYRPYRLTHNFYLSPPHDGIGDVIGILRLYYNNI